MLRLTLFGGFRLHRNGRDEISFDLAKQRALVAYLALNAGKPLTRSLLAALLWGDQSEERARHSLSQALSSIAAKLGDDAPILERTKQAVGLAESGIEVDVFRFRGLAVSARAGDLSKAVHLFDPDLLAEFTFDEPAFDDWAMAARGECQDLALRAGTAYLSAEPHARDVDESIQIARKLLMIDPFHEPAHRALIRDYLSIDDIGAAHKQAEICRTVLREELGVDPGPETERLILSIRAPREPTSIEAMRSSGRGEPADIPSIIVLPMENMTGDPALSHICEGLSDDISTELARHRSFFVISHESAFQFSAKAESVMALCERLGVRHALCGSLRPYRDKARINLRLVEGSSGRTVWGERYDFDREELFQISDDVIENLVTRLSRSLEDDAYARSKRKPPTNWTAYEHVLHGLTYHHRSWYGTGNLLGAVKHFRRAIELDPDCARAHAYLACTIAAPWFKDRRMESLDRCLEHARRAAQLDPFEAEAQRVLGAVFLIRGEHGLSGHHFEQAKKVHPGNAHVLAHAARYHAHTGGAHDAVSHLNRARQLNPLHPAWYWEHLGIAEFGRQEYHSATQFLCRLHVHSFYDRLYSAAAYAHMNDRSQAEHHLKTALSEKPGLDCANVGYYLPYSRHEDLEHVVAGLRKAGLPG